VGTAPIPTQQTFVTGDGGLIAFWVEGTLQSGSLHVRTTSASPGGGFVGVQSLSSGRPGGGQVRFAVNAAGRAAELFPLATSGGTTLKVQLRTPSGTWGSVRTLGLAGRSVGQTNIGVDSGGRVVALWDDGSSSSSGPTRILSARSSSSSDPLGSYNQVSQRSGDMRCREPTLFLSTSGDGLGSWACSTRSSGSNFTLRLARLTRP
jgi:hypothetical protein